MFELTTNVYFVRMHLTVVVELMHDTANARHTIVVWYRKAESWHVSAEYEQGRPQMINSPPPHHDLHGLARWRIQFFTGRSRSAWLQCHQHCLLLAREFAGQLHKPLARSAGKQCLPRTCTARGAILHHLLLLKIRRLKKRRSGARVPV
jgi:hypothetical protein